MPKARAGVIMGAHTDIADVVRKAGRMVIVPMVRWAEINAPRIAHDVDAAHHGLIRRRVNRSWVYRDVVADPYRGRFVAAKQSAKPGSDALAAVPSHTSAWPTVYPIMGYPAMAFT